MKRGSQAPGGYEYGYGDHEQGSQAFWKKFIFINWGIVQSIMLMHNKKENESLNLNTEQFKIGLKLRQTY